MHRTPIAMTRIPFLNAARTSAALGAAVLLAPISGAAQDAAPKGTDSVVQAVSEAYQALDGQEVRIDGAIGEFVGGLLYFIDETGRYSIKLDAGRDVRRRIEGCTLNMFDAASSPCQVIGMAEISIDADDDNVGDGVEIGLVLYDVESLEVSAD